jgi:hypothetical protein
MTCYGCGEKGHIAKDPKCKNFGKSKPGAKMFAAREILDEDDDGRADDGVVDQDRESGDHDENDQIPWDQYDSDVVGSQYSSEGEEVEFDEFDDGHWDHVDRVEQMYALRIKSMSLLDSHNKFAAFSELDFDEPIVEEYNIYDPQDEDQDFPLLQEVSDSESETEPVRKESSEGEFPILVESDDSEESDGDDEDIIAIEFNELFSAMKAGEVTKPPAAKHPITLRKSSQKLTRPVREPKENQCFVTLVEIHGQPAVALLDSGCTTDAISPELANVARMKVHELTEQVPLQLGTAGSRSKINYGVNTHIVYGPIKTDHYFDVINIDRYDAILGTLFMRKHGIVLDFELNQVRRKNEQLFALEEGGDSYLMVRRMAMNKHRETLVPSIVGKTEPTTNGTVEPSNLPRVNDGHKERPPAAPNKDADNVTGNVIGK